MTIDELNAVVDGISAGFKDRFDAINRRLAAVEEKHGTESDTPDLRELMATKVNQLENQCAAHRKHLSNLESRIAKLTATPLKPYSE